MPTFPAKAFLMPIFILAIAYRSDDCCCILGSVSDMMIRYNKSRKKEREKKRHGKQISGRMKS